MSDAPLLPADPAALVEALRVRTPARVLAGRSGTAYRTATQLALRRDHAFARDAVAAELDLGPDLVRDFRLFTTATRAPSKQEYLRRPDLGRRFSPESRAQVAERCPPGPDLQVVIGDGLSATAVRSEE